MTEEENKIKISYPLFTSIEEAQLENTLNFHLEEFVNEINKTMSKDKDIIILKKVIENQQKEIEELKKDNEEQWRHRCKMAIQLDNNVVSKDKIREKIKEIDKKAFEYKCNYSEYYYKKEVLKELLEE